MNKITLITALLLGSFFGAHAQPVLTSGTNNPSIGQTFISHICDTTGVTANVTGAGVTWDYSWLSETGLDTTQYIDCVPTTYIDSFPGSNLAAGSDSSYWYYNVTTNGFAVLGLEEPGFQQRYSRHYYIYPLPLIYNSIYADTSVMYVSPIPYSASLASYDAITDSFICDGYGTLKLPSGTFSNVLRVHKIEYLYYNDSTFVPGFTSIPHHYYLWLMPGFDQELLYISPDYYVFYNTSPTEGVATLTKHTLSMNISPNPSSDLINVTFTAAATQKSALLVYNLLGQKVADVPDIKTQAGSNTITLSVKDLPSGSYIAELTADGQKINGKFLVTSR